jgi:hypothetical protein
MAFGFEEKLEMIQIAETDFHGRKINHGVIPLEKGAGINDGGFPHFDHSLAGLCASANNERRGNGFNNFIHQ